MLVVRIDRYERRKERKSRTKKEIKADHLHTWHFETSPPRQQFPRPTARQSCYLRNQRLNIRLFYIGNKVARIFFQISSDSGTNVLCSVLSGECMRVMFSESGGKTQIPSVFILQKAVIFSRFFGNTADIKQTIAVFCFKKKKTYTEEGIYKKNK